MYSRIQHQPPFLPSHINLSCCKPQAHMVIQQVLFLVLDKGHGFCAFSHGDGESLFIGCGCMFVWRPNSCPALTKSMRLDDIRKT